ncbi:hypothetical protein AMECASPLE_031185 [Ameca splendens]|uniref:Uncharacterized protein n=1 Tax=Ameca splendens TaxID=208324 RepID=A0ABV0YU35_9TELE
MLGLLHLCSPKPPVTPAVRAPANMCEHAALMLCKQTLCLFGTLSSGPATVEEREKVSKGNWRKQGEEWQGWILNSLARLPEVCYFTGGNLPACFIACKLQPVC